MKVIIPMAGLGTRFQKVASRNPEYSKPKPFINVKKWPMVRWATGSLPFFKHKGNDLAENTLASPKDAIFIILKEHNNKHQMEEKLREIYGPEISVVILEKTTRGAAETVFNARHLINPDEDIVITDSDHFFDGSHLLNAINNKQGGVAGIIPVFIPFNDGIPKWSYSLINPNTRYIEKVAEKDRTLMEAGAYANIGAYYFSKAKYFLDITENIIQKNQTFGTPGKEEFYIAPIYQLLIDQGHKVEAVFIPEVWGLGTPEDLERFLTEANFDYPAYK